MFKHHKEKNLRDEVYRQISTNILYSSYEGKPNTLLFTSPTLKEGKNSVIYNLIISFSNMDKKVLAIDFNFRKPELNMKFNIENEKGLVSVLNGEIDLYDAIYEVNNNLHILTTGQPIKDMIPVILPENIRYLQDELKDKYDLIIIDAPPILLAPMTQVLSSIADRTILIISEGKTKTTQLHQAQIILDNSKAKNIGVIYNFASMHKKDYEYY